MNEHDKTITVNGKQFVMVALRQEPELGQFSVVLDDDQCELSKDADRNVFFIALVSVEMVKHIRKTRGQGK